MRVRIKFSALLALLIMVAGHGRVFAQFTTASLAGTVTDPSGALVVGATVTAENTQTGLIRRTASDTDGVYRFPALPIGTWKLRTEKAGFSVAVVEEISLTTNQAATVDVTLQVGAVAAELQVTAAAALVNTQNATVGQLVDQQRVVELPLNGRTPQSLVFITPGAVNVGITGSQGGVYPTEQGAAVNGGGRM